MQVRDGIRVDVASQCMHVCNQTYDAGFETTLRFCVAITLRQQKRPIRTSTLTSVKVDTMSTAIIKSLSTTLSSLGPNSGDEVVVVKALCVVDVKLPVPHRLVVPR